MKLYDYSKRRSKSKDLQWDQVDEEIRRIWDSLYNRRFQYPNQTGSGGTGLAFPRPTFDGKNIFQLIQTVDSTVVGTNTVNIANTFSTAVMSIDFEAAYYSVTNAGVGGQEISTPSGIVGNGRQFRFNPYYQVWLKTPSALTNYSGTTSINSGLHDLGSDPTSCRWMYNPSVSNKWFIELNGEDTYLLFEDLPDIDVNTQYFMTMQFEKTDTNIFTGTFGFEYEQRDSNGVLIIAGTHSFTEENISLDEDTELHFYALISDNNGGSGNINIKFHSAYYEHSRGS